MNFATWLGTLIGEAIRPIIKDAVKEALREVFETRAEVSKPDPGLQSAWDNGLRASNHDPEGRSNHDLETK